MKRSTLRTPLLFALAVSIGGCTTVGQTGRQSEVVGTVSLPDGAELDQKSVVVISLVDLDRMDVINQVQHSTAQPTISFAVAYDRSEINSAHRYAVEAVVIEQGRPRYKNEPLDRVLTQGNPAEVEVLVAPFD